MNTVEKIMFLLQSKNLEQKDLADFLGIRRQTITDWKSGKTQSYNKYIEQIANFFDVSVDYLLDRTEEPKVISNSYNQNGNNNFQAVDSTTEFSKRDVELIQKINSLDFNDYVYIINYVNDRISNAK